jgi:putative oxidoreductase
MDVGLLIARFILGFALAAHGAQKLFGWFGGYGLKGTSGFFEGLGFRPGTLFAAAAGLGEFGGGLLTAAGLLGPVGPALIVLVMLVAIFSVHWPNGFFVQSNGIELPLMNLAGALAIAFAGPGAFSLDGILGITGFSQPSTAWAVIGVAVVIAVLNLAVRHRPAPKSAASHS